MRIKSIIEEATNGPGMGAAIASDSAAIGMLSMARKPIRCVRSESLTPTRGKPRDSVLSPVAKCS